MTAKSAKDYNNKTYSIAGNFLFGYGISRISQKKVFDEKHNTSVTITKFS
jgi:hypothetical protein